MRSKPWPLFANTGAPAIPAKIYIAKVVTPKVDP